MNVFEDLVVQLKEENLLETTVIENNEADETFDNEFGQPPVVEEVGGESESAFEADSSRMSDSVPTVTTELAEQFEIESAQDASARLSADHPIQDKKVQQGK